MLDFIHPKPINFLKQNGINSEYLKYLNEAMNLPLGPLMKLWIISKAHQLATKTLPSEPSWVVFIFKSNQLRNHP